MAAVERHGQEIEGRAGRVWQLYAVQRWTQEAVARELGISQQRVSAILAGIREAMPAIDRTAMVRESVEQLDNISRRLFELAEKEGAPVTAGKDGDVVYDPETGAIVRDYGGRIAALREIRATNAELRRLLGLDAAQKVETTAHVKYEVVGVDPEALS